MRGRAFQYGFFAYFIYFMTFNAFQVLTKERWINNRAGIFLGICLATFVFAAYAIWNEAYLSLRRNAKSYVLVLSAIAFLNLAIGFSRLARREELGEDSLNLMVGILLLLLVPVFGAKKLKDKAQDGTE